ncbi:Uma2 family endonuclease [Leptothoe spongobia]|uniref:Uma2 family endonuclease n=1 Tax=Leptothoe spongobia TAU-MAC 1115 TaxID=1967444 RepID=A0A947GI96_9CYAN|nr:Uma2 family endonuclease [Leptothoe spongobia]MBT9315970.1 Uma2 family endonuclease [Leptothoe spongobia TAU-MAC 1115]
MTALLAPLVLDLDLTDEQFLQLCQKNHELKFERTASGELIIMAPTGGETGRRNVKLTTQLDLWNTRTNLGEVFDSSTGFKLPNGADRSPDAAWVKRSRWDALTPAQREKFVPLCPDFVVELMSPSDSLERTRQKMEEYRDNGARLGWLLHRKQRQVEIYRPNQSPEILDNPQSLSDEEVLPGFVLNLTLIW